MLVKVLLLLLLCVCVCVCVHVHISVCVCVCVRVCTTSSFLIKSKLFSVHYILRTFATTRVCQVLFSVQKVIYILANN